MRSFFRSFFTVSFYTVISRILGFVRDIFIAKYSPKSPTILLVRIILEVIGILSSLSNRLGSSLDQLVGIVSPQEVLDHIFTNFCIGK